jgi:hypothetical protein
MRKTTAAFVVLALVLAAWGDEAEAPQAGAASTSTATAGPPVTPSGALGGYQPVSDVGQHAKMSADVCDVNTLLDARPIDFATIGVIYRDGRHSTEANGSKRTLGKFAREPRSTENLLGRYERYLGAGWLDAFASAAIGGTGPFAGEADLVRRQGVQKGVRNQVLVAWAFHELDAAVDKATKSNFDKDTGAPHNWDEARAYYHGERPECAPYATAEERGREFGTGSAVNEAILAAMQQGLKALLAEDTTGAAKARDEVVRQVTITYIQSAIKYSAEMDAALAQGKADDARVWQAEGWAYFRVIEPLIAGVNPTSARAVTGVFDLKARPAPGSGEKVVSALAKTYEALGIRPSEVGQYRATKVLSTFGPDDGFVSEPDMGLVFASLDPLAHDMLSLAWLVESRRALPASRRSGPIDDPNTSSLAVNFGNRIVTHWLGGIGQALRTQHLTRHDLDTLWDDRVLRRAFELAGGVPRVELEDADGSFPAELRGKLEAELALPA